MPLPPDLAKKLTEDKAASRPSADRRTASATPSVCGPN